VITLITYFYFIKVEITPTPQHDIYGTSLDTLPKFPKASTSTYNREVPNASHHSAVSHSVAMLFLETFRRACPNVGNAASFRRPHPRSRQDSRPED
jgi:hypothetical protein